MMAVPFAASLSEAAMLNAVGLNMPEAESGLVVPVVLSIDIERWNRLADELVGRLGALSPPIEEVDFAVKTWSLTDKGAAQQVERVGARLKAGEPAGQVLREAGDAGKWRSRVVAEANSPTIQASQSKSQPGSQFGSFFLAGFLRVDPGPGAAAFPHVVGQADESKPGVIGVVMGVKGGQARISYFRPGVEAVAALRKQMRPGSRLDVAIVEGSGGTIASEPCGLEFRSGARRVFFSEGSRAFAGAPAEPVRVIVPGAYSTEEVVSWATGPSDATRGAVTIDTCWMGFLKFDFPEADIEWSEEIKVRCVPMTGAEN